MPEWYTTVAAGAAVAVVGVLLLVNLIVPIFTNDNSVEATGPVVSDTPSEPAVTDPENPAVLPEVPVDPASPSAVPEDAPTGNAPSIEMVPLAGPDGSTQLVPAAANDQAMLAAAALYTSDYTGINLPEGFTPNLTATSTGVKVNKLTVDTIDPVSISFKAEVDINGAGDVRTFPLTLVIENGVWIYYPPGA